MKLCQQRYHVSIGHKEVGKCTTVCTWHIQQTVFVYECICSSLWEQTYQFSWRCSELATPSVRQHAEKRGRRLL